MTWHHQVVLLGGARMPDPAVSQYHSGDVTDDSSAVWKDRMEMVLFYFFHGDATIYRQDIDFFNRFNSIRAGNWLGFAECESASALVKEFIIQRFPAPHGLKSLSGVVNAFIMSPPQSIR